jgi:hypothetical protein
MQELLKQVPMNVKGELSRWIREGGMGKGKEICMYVYMDMDTHIPNVYMKTIMGFIMQTFTKSLSQWKEVMKKMQRKKIMSKNLKFSFTSFVSKQYNIIYEYSYMQT